MNLNNISQIKYNGKEIVLGRLNGQVVYEKILDPENPEIYYIEYTVASSTRRLNEGTDQYKYGIPSIMGYDGKYKFEYSKVEITLTNGTITDDLNTACSNVSKVKLWYPKDTKSIKFEGSSSYKPLVKTVDYVKTDNFTAMNNMFYYCQSLTSINTSKWNTSKVTSMSNMFYYCKSLTSLNLSNFNTSKVTSMNHMFYYTSGTLDISNFTFDSGSVYMFENTQIKSVTAKNCKSKSTTLQGIFYNNNAIKTIDLTGCDFSNVKSLYGLFWNSKALTSIIGLSYILHNKLENISNIFSGCSRLSITLVLEDFMSNVTNASGAFNGLSRIDLPVRNILPALEDASYMFANTTIDGENTYLFQFPNLRNMSHMFDGVRTNYKDIHIYEPFNQVEDVSYAFANASSAYIYACKGAMGTGGNISFHFPNCYNYEGVCQYSNPISIKVQGNCQSAFECAYGISFSCIGPITNANSMFKGCQEYNLYLNDLDMSQCYDMSYMFAECYNLQELDISNWNVTSCTTTNSMFYDCTSLYSLNLKYWETYNIYDYYDMFYNVSDSCFITVRYNYFTLNESDTGFNGTFNWEW